MFDEETTAKAWIQGTAGQQERRAMVITPLDLRPEQIDLDDIARSLGFICRYTGRTRRFYSVAEHSVIVYEAAKALGFSLAAQRWALVHDFEKTIDIRIRKRFGILVTPEEIAAVRALDVEACNVERLDLLEPEPKPWDMPTAPDGYATALVRAYMAFRSQRERYDLTFGSTLRLYARAVLGQ